MAAKRSTRVSTRASVMWTPPGNMVFRPIADSWQHRGWRLIASPLFPHSPFRRDGSQPSLCRHHVRASPEISRPLLFYSRRAAPADRGSDGSDRTPGGTATGPSSKGSSVRRIQSLSRERSEEHTAELQSLMRISYAVFCLKKKNKKYKN